MNAISHQIRKNFSKAAGDYDNYSQLQNEIGLELLENLVTSETQRYVLDIGMGTGWLMNKLTWRYPYLSIIGLDAAFGMVHLAKQKHKGLKILQSDAQELPFQTGQFDILFSNAAYQWVHDLKAAFKESYRVLKHDGEFHFTIFTRRSLEEMFISIEEYWKTKKDAEPEALRRLPESQEILKTLREAGFEKIESRLDLFKVYFKDMIDLLGWLKKIGANSSERKTFLGKELILGANEFYKKNFCDQKGPFASFEVLKVKAIK